MARDAYVRNVAATCEQHTCMYGAARRTLEDTLEVIDKQIGRRHMSQALWCDQSGHAFSERDPGRQRITVTVLDDQGDEQPETRDLCGACAETAGLLQPRKTRAEIPAANGG